MKVLSGSQWQDFGAATLIALMASLPLHAQSGAEALAAKERLRLEVLESKLTTVQGYGLNTQTIRPGLVTMQSVLLPPRQVAPIFGRKIADNMAVVRITISNSSRDAAFLLEMLGVDYSDWKLSSCDLESLKQTAPFRGSNLSDEDLKAIDVTPSPGDKDSPGSVHKKKGKPQPAELQLHDLDTFAYPCRVNSLELRDVRQVARVGQLTSTRNTTLRAVKDAGVVGGALTGVFTHSTSLPRGLAAWNSGLLPALDDFWKDLSEDQINLLNDVAFRINTIVPKESALTVTAFYPIDRFLSSQFRALFESEPAIFFAPQQYLAKTTALADLKKRRRDKEANRKQQLYDRFFLDLLDRFADLSIGAETKCLAEEAKVQHVETVGSPTDLRKSSDEDKLNYSKNCELRALLSELSLNRVFTVATGEFVADISTVSPEITSVKFDQDEKAINTFGQAGKLTGQIAGHFLAGADAQILNAKALNVQIGTIADGSDDSVLKFALTLVDPIPPDSTIQFVAVKHSHDRDLPSNTYEKVVNYRPTKAPSVTGPPTANAGATVKLIGTNFYDSKAFPILVQIAKKPGDVPSVQLSDAKVVSPTEIDVTLPKDASGNYKIRVAVTGLTAAEFTISISKASDADSSSPSKPSVPKKPRSTASKK